MSATATPTLIRPDDGGVELSFGRLMFKIGPGHGSTGLGLIDVTLAPGGAFPFPHVHDDVEEAFYVLEGEVDFLLETPGSQAVPAAPCSSRPGVCMRFATTRAGRRGSL